MTRRARSSFFSMAIALGAAFPLAESARADERKWSTREVEDALQASRADVEACTDKIVDSRERTTCLLGRVFAKDASALGAATKLFDETGTLAGLQAAETLDGGFRGTIQIVPEAPVGGERRHLTWVASALTDFDSLFGELAKGTPAPPPPSYRWRGLTLRFFRSKGRTTPSAFASDWTVAYNVNGSLHTSEGAVRETMFHEIFHLNDAARGDWSPRVLGVDYRAIVKKCGTDVRCLAPYAPGDTKVRGGTYYAFQPDNGVSVREYGAELALRWYREQRAIVRGEPVKRPFKCGPPENARAWRAIVDEFFHVDRVPACP